MKGTFLFLSMILGCCKILQAQQVVDTKRIDLSVTSKADGKLNKDLKPRDINISFKNMKIKDGDRIEDLLAVDGLSTIDKDIYKLVYELNPQFLQLDSLPVDSIIRMPVVTVKNGSIRPDEIISIRLDEELRQNILKTHGQLETAAKENKSNLVHKQSDTASIRYLNENLMLINQMTNAIHERTAIISREQLVNLNWVIKKTKKQVLDPVTPVSATDIALLNTSLALWAKNFSEVRGDQMVPGNNKVEVTITIKRINNVPITPNLYRVYYCAPGLEPEGASPITINALHFTYKMDQANWFFWIKKVSSTSPYPPDGEKILASVFSGRTNQIDLIIAE